MIRFLLLQNRAGKTRLAKYYVPMDDAEKHATEYDVHKIISTRDPKFTNFVEVAAPPPPDPMPRPPCSPHSCCSTGCIRNGDDVSAAEIHLTRCSQFKAHKVIYRRYAGLFFVLCVDVTDNELAYLESVHLFVEILDHYFNNVCELDLVFNFHKVRV